MTTVLGSQSLARMVMNRAATQPGHIALATMDDSVSYAQLADLSVQFARHLRRHHLRSGMCLAIVPDHPIIAVGLTLACSLLGCAWVAASPQVLAQPGIAVSCVLHMDTAPPGLRVPALRVDPSWSRAPGGSREDAEAPFTGYSDPQQFWMITHSSGTTGEPKLIGLPEAAFYQRVTEIGFVSEAERPVYLAMFPLLAYTGTLAMFRTLAAGGTFVYADPRQIHGHTRIDVIHGSPAHLQRFMDGTPPGTTRIPLARLGGGVAGPGLFRRLLQYCDRVMHVYGSTEAGTTATRIMGLADIGDFTPSVGHVIPGARVDIIDAAGEVLPWGAEGIIRIQTPSLATGYIGDPDLSASVFRDGWFHPGDLGVLSSQGELRITGRVNDQLNIGGSKLNPVTIDTAAQEIPGVADAACFAFQDADGIDRVALAVSLFAPVDLPHLAGAVRDAVVARVGRAGAPRALFVLDSIPRNPNGKTARASLPAATAAITPIPIAAPPAWDLETP